ncbi:Krev interaction trapped protein 1 [Holothuria leucospilota]|uniref:Krev interaction trapped protein 1 n=1 Tax=Holothuria leucospilota TaxID=206669 RepID=A0A9Q0YEQ6_HOLLE|nr:Krev interaction trapped protein 1 [Holothuria leucospilota]
METYFFQIPLVSVEKSRRAKNKRLLPKEFCSSKPLNFPNMARSRSRPLSGSSVRGHVTNPAYITEVNAVEYRTSPLEALRKMEILEHCDKTILNPFFHAQTDLPLHNTKFNNFIRVNRVVINPFFGMGVPDYSKMQSAESVSPPFATIHNPGSNWIDQHPLHSAAWEGHVENIQHLLEMGYAPDQCDTFSWVPLHYACWNGHVEAVRALLQSKLCSPNIENEGGSVPLHYAASKGYHEIVQLLVTHRDTDKFALTREGKNALQLCEEAKPRNWEETVSVLKSAAQSPSPKIDVHLMDLDSSHVVLDLVRGSNTTVQDLITQLHLPKGCNHVFAIWIASQNLHLQMRPEHKPVLHLKQWAIIVEQLTNYNPADERPLLYLKRDALLSVEDEKTIKDPQAVKMLFEECHLNVLRGMYPCSDEDALCLAGINMQLVYGDFDPKKHKHGFLNDINLRHFLPAVKLDGRGSASRATNWPQRIVNQYKQTSQQGTKDQLKLQMKYLELCRGFPVYGSAFFFGSAQLKTSVEKSSKKSPAVFIGVNSRGIHLINTMNKTILLSVGYKQGLYWQNSPEQSMLTIRIQDGASGKVVPVKTKQAAVICNLANKLSGRQFMEDQPSTSGVSRHTLPKPAAKNTQLTQHRSERR